MDKQEIETKLIAAYDKMLERLHILVEDAEEQALPVLQQNLEKVKKQAVELKEISSDEAEKVASYLKRDMHDAADYLETSGKELATWFSFDLHQVETRMLDMFSRIADRTRIDLTRLAKQAEIAQKYHTGEITGIGTLACDACGSVMHFKKTSRIPPCPKCHKTNFERITE